MSFGFTLNHGQSAGTADLPAETLVSLSRITPKAVRFVRLGRGGECAEGCLSGGEVGLGFDERPHDLCLAGDWAAIKADFLKAGETPGTAENHTREVREFYTLGADTLWVTAWQGKVWWAFAEPEVAWHEELRQQLPRRRKAIGAWRSTDIEGRPLLLSRLSTNLTQSFAYRGTICEVAEPAYLVRRINGEVEPLAAKAEAAQAAVIEVAKAMITKLHWKDFEVLVDRIFADSGWRRVGVLGETQADVDLVVEQTATRERAFVQVKSKANTAVLKDYLERFSSAGDCGRMFFICHSPSRDLAKAAPPHSKVELWFADTLARRAVRSGQFEWLIERTR